MDLRDYLIRIQADIAESLKLVPAPPPPPAVTTLTTADALMAALATGGTFKLGDGTFTGNFLVTKPVTLTGSRNAVLAPKDLLTPTLRVQSGGVAISGLTVQSGAPDRECIVVGTYEATTVEAQPDGVVLDGLAVMAGINGGKRGIALHGRNLTVKNCRVTNFYGKGIETQAIWIHNGPGPYTVTDNYLEASGEVIMSGGSSIKIPNCIPSDILIARNICFKPDTWRTLASPVKNSIEIKNGRRVVIEDNVCDGNWRNGQDGNPIVLTARNQDGDTPWVLVDEVTIRRNRTVRCNEGFAVGLLGFDSNAPSQQTKTVTIEHNLFTDSPNGFNIGNGVATALIIRFNTLPAVVSNLIKLYDSRVPPVKSPLTFTQNVARSGEYGVSGTDMGVGVPSLTAYTTLVDFTGNVIEKSAVRGIAWPAGNTLVEPGALTGMLDPTTFKTTTGTAGY